MSVLADESVASCRFHGFEVLVRLVRRVGQGGRVRRPLVERADRRVSRTSDARNRDKNRYTRTDVRPASRQVNDHGRVSGTHRPTCSTPPSKRAAMPEIDRYSDVLGLASLTGIHRINA